MSTKEVVNELPPAEVLTEGAESAPKQEDDELTQLPNLEIAHFYDPDTGNAIMTREDLVVVITSHTLNSCLVQHADGTHIYSEVKEMYVPPHQLTQGELMMEQIEEPFPTGQNIMEEVVQGKEKHGEKKKPSVMGVEKVGSMVNGELDNIVSIEMKKDLDKKKNGGQKAMKGAYEKKHALIGTEATFLEKPGVKTSWFAEAQKKHSQTWAPEGYGEAPAAKPDWVWPPQEPGTPKRRYENTTPRRRPRQIYTNSRFSH